MTNMTNAKSYSINPKELLLGVFRPANYAKVFVFVCCGLILAWIVFSGYYTVRGLTGKKQVPTQTIGTNSGMVTTLNSSDKNEAKSFQLISLGGCNGKN